MDFASELNAVLPAGLPHRDAVIAGGAKHLELIVEANKVLNLTRITSPREAAIKHVLDSVIPWALFRDADHVLDAGTGAGFPGIPLAIVLPETRFTLAESIQKKARFVESALKELKLPNVEITPRRAEELRAGLIMKLRGGVDKVAPWILLVEASRPEALAAFRDGPGSNSAFARLFGSEPASRGIYQLQFALTKAEL